MKPYDALVSAQTKLEDALTYIRSIDSQEVGAATKRNATVLISLALEQVEKAKIRIFTL